MQFMEYPLVVEVRHNSWNQPEVFEWLREQGVGFCNIDQPVIGRSLAPSEQVTAGRLCAAARAQLRTLVHLERASGRALQLPLQLEELKPWAERVATSREPRRSFS